MAQSASFLETLVIFLSFIYFRRRGPQEFFLTLLWRSKCPTFVLSLTVTHHSSFQKSSHNDAYTQRQPGSLPSSPLHVPSPVSHWGDLVLHPPELLSSQHFVISPVWASDKAQAETTIQRSGFRLGFQVPAGSFSEVRSDTGWGYRAKQRLGLGKNERYIFKEKLVGRKR